MTLVIMFVLAAPIVLAMRPLFRARVMVYLYGVIRRDVQ